MADKNKDRWVLQLLSDREINCVSLFQCDNEIMMGDCLVRVMY